MYYFKEYSHYLLRRLIRKHRVGGTLLEVGCGRGENLVFLARLGFDGAGIDLSQSALEHARHRLAAEASRIVLLHRDLFAMEGAFNLVVALDVLEHIADEKKALNQMHHLLGRQNSLLILGVPGGPYMADDPSFGHFRRYEREGLIRLLRQCHFEVKDCLTLGYPFLYYARVLANRLTKLPADHLTPAELEANTLNSDVEHPLKNSIFAKALNAALGFPPSRMLLRALLRTQDVFSRWPTGHVYLVAASPCPSNASAS